MSKRLLTLLLIWALVSSFSACSPSPETTTSVAVEFNNHAAAAYVADVKGWFEAEGLGLVPLFQVYESGAAIAAALARNDIQIGYLGLTGAITTYTRGVPIKVLAGVHKYGYGLVVKPEIMKVEDLQGTTIASLREGTVTDYLLNLLIDRHHLENITILRMSPSEEVIALIGGHVDAAFIPEQHASLAESKGFPMLIKSQDLWPGMQGDVLVIRSELIEGNPQMVERLVGITHEATLWINDHPEETARIMAQQLQATSQRLSPLEEIQDMESLEVTPEIISRSMGRIEYSTSINPAIVQETIDFMVELGYIKGGVTAADILDLRYLKND
jgi:NitT/TauT family transport system substrate-binding protein